MATMAERGAAPATRPPEMEAPGEGGPRPDRNDGSERPGRPSSSSPAGTTTGCQELALRAVRAGLEPEKGERPEQGDRRSVTKAQAARGDREPGVPAWSARMEV